MVNYGKHPYSRYAGALYKLGRAMYRSYSDGTPSPMGAFPASVAQAGTPLSIALGQGIPSARSFGVRSRVSPRHAAQILTNTALQKTRIYRRATKRRGALTGRSAGFHKPTKRVLRRSKRAKRIKKGVVKTVETGGELSDKYCIHMIHHSNPLLQLFKVGCITIVKKLVEKYLGVQISNLTDVPDFGSSGSVKLDCTYYVSSSATAFSSFSLDVDNVSIEESGVNFFNQLMTVLRSNPAAEFWRVQLYRDGGNYDRVPQIHLRGLSFEAYVKSSLKLQNRSANADGTEADEVDNVPLYGKIYHAPGTGFIYNDQHRDNSPTLGFSPYIVDQMKGVTSLLSLSDQTGALREPPRPEYFNNCRKFNKVRLEPGAIKTSVLSFKKTISFVKMVSLLQAYYSGSGGPKFLAFSGSSNMISLEKIIETTSGEADPAVPLVVAYECNVLYEVSIHEKFAPIAAQLFEKV